MKIQRAYSLVRQALQKYNMISDGDKVAVGVSGGKDSLGLLLTLAGLSEFYPKKFQLCAITVDLGFEGFNLDKVGEFCASLNVPYCIVKTEISKAASEKGCPLCAKMRKGALLNKAKELGCGKIAYAHNKDDMVETMLLSLMHEGRFSTFWPVTHFDDTDISIIRPYMYVSQADAKGLAAKYELPVVSNPCPYDKSSERAYVRDLISELNKHTPGVTGRMFNAIENSNIFPDL